MEERCISSFHYPFRIRIPILSNSYIVIEHMEILNESHTICPHKHAYHEIYYCTKGNLDLKVGDKTTTIVEGEYCIIPAYVQHQTLYTVHPKSFFVVTFGIELKSDRQAKSAHSQDYLFLSDLNNVLNNAVCLWGADTCAADESLNAIVAEFNSKSFGWFPMMRNACLEFIVRIARNVFPSSDRTTSDLHSDNNLAIELLRFICIHFREDIKLEDIAESAHVSPRHACRIFENCLGVTMRYALHACRINAAKELLLSKDNRIEQIAAQVGYAEPDSFARWFKRIEGCTVTQYRAQSALRS